MGETVMAGFDLSGILGGLMGGGGAAGAGGGMGGLGSLASILGMGGGGQGQATNFDPRMIEGMQGMMPPGVMLPGMGTGPMMPGMPGAAPMPGAGVQMPQEGAAQRELSPLASAMLRMGPGMMQAAQPQQMQQPGALPIAGAMGGMNRRGPGSFQGYMAQGGGIAPSRRIVGSPF